MRPVQLPEEQVHLEGSLFFGFGIPAVAQLIEQLPGTTACEGFQPRYSRPDALQKAPPLPRNPSGCARTEPFQRRTSAFKASHEIYHRPFINRGALQRHHEDGGDDEAQREGDGEGIGREALRKRDTETKTMGVAQVERRTDLSLKKLHYNVVVKRSAIHNWGLFTTRPVTKDSMVVEYKGQAIRSIIADAWEKKYESGALKGQGGDCYMFRLDADVVLDATQHGNVARFMNHCCQPNCYSKVIEVEGRKHIIIFAHRDLEEGEEIMYDYKFATEREKIACHCGHPKCLGVMN